MERAMKRALILILSVILLGSTSASASPGFDDDPQRRDRKQGDEKRGDKKQPPGPIVREEKRGGRDRGDRNDDRRDRKRDERPPRRP